MRMRALFFASLLLCIFASSLSAQLPPVKTEPLHAPQGIQGAVGCSATDASSCAQAAAKIMPVVMGESPLEENLRRLTDEIGGRVSGSPEMAEAVDWAVAAFRAAGVEVHTEKYLLPATWSEGDTRLELSGPVQFRVSLVSGGLSPATPPGGMEGALIDVGEGSEAEFARAGSAVKGAILIVHGEVSYNWQELFAE